MGWKLNDLSPELQKRIREADAKKKTPKADVPPAEVAPEEQPEEEAPLEPPRFLREGNKLTVWMEAIGAPRQVQGDRWNPSPRVLRYRAWKDRYRSVVPEDLLENCCGLDYVAYFERAQSWSIKKFLQWAGQPHEFKPDADNIWKALTDGVFKEDSQIYKGSMEKLWDDGRGPRIEITFHHKMTPTTTAFRETVSKAHEEGKRLRLERYYSDKGKKVSTMIIRLLPEGGYDQLVADSVKEFEEREDELTAALLEKFPGEVELIMKCCGEQVRAWQRRIDGVKSAHNNVMGQEALTDSGKGYHTKDSDPFLTVLFGAVLEDEIVHQEHEKKAGKIGKTAVKNALKNMLPLGKFRGRLNLDMDNVDDVVLLED